MEQSELDILIKFTEDCIVTLNKEKQTWQGDQHFDTVCGQIAAYQNMHDMLMFVKTKGE